MMDDGVHSIDTLRWICGGEIKNIKSVNKLEKFKISDFSNLMLLFRSKLYKCLFQLYNNTV